MLNYISAELYKLRHKKTLFAGMAVLLLLESALFLPGFWKVPLDGDQLIILLHFLDATLPFGLFLAPIFAALVFDDQNSRGTLKNEIVFGIPRSRIYLGKLLTAMLAGTLAALTAVLWYGGCVFLLSRKSGGIPPECWASALLTAAGAWFTWLAAVSFAFFLLVAIRGSAAALAAAYLISFVGVPLGLVSYERDPVAAFDFLWLFSRLFYSSPYLSLLGVDTTWLGLKGPLLNSALVGLSWVAATTLLGLLLLRRREIR